MTADDEFNRQDDEAPIVIPIEDSLDLHAFAPGEVRSVVDEYLFQCRQKGHREVRIVHGRGRGVQRNIVRALLARCPWVLEFKDASFDEGGWGATVVRLKTEQD